MSRRGNQERELSKGQTRKQHQWFRRLLFSAAMFALTLVLLGFASLQGSALVMKSEPLTPKAAAQARQTVKDVVTQMSSDDTQVGIRLSQQDVDAVARLASHTFDGMALHIGFNQFGAIVASSIRPFEKLSLYMNVKCEVLPSRHAYSLDACTLGRVPVPGVILEWMAKLLMTVIFDRDVGDSVARLFRDMEVSAKYLTVRTQKMSVLKTTIDKSTLITDDIRPVQQIQNPASQLVAAQSSGSAVGSNLGRSEERSTDESYEKKLLKGRYLELVGGYQIPWVELEGRRIKPQSLDLLPNSTRWISGHASRNVVELIEPAEMGTGTPNSWPMLTLGRSTPALKGVKKLGPSGVLWLSEDEVLTSGRKSYRSGFTPNWIAKVNLKTGTEQRFTITAPTNTEPDNFHVLQALGGGFVRLTDRDWAYNHVGGAEFLLGRGGYDVLGSPLGPALGYWELGAPTARFLLDFPHTEQPARRDHYYVYPERDPSTYEKAQLPMWRDPDEQGGFWQAGDVGGIAFIHHPQVKGVLVTHNHGRGVHDYRAQGDWGSGSYFLVANPSTFYSTQSNGNRGDHQSETLNATYPAGVFARVGHIIDPAHIAEVADGRRNPWDIPTVRFEWPREGIRWSEEARNHTKLGMPVWDSARQWLWVAIGNRKKAYLAAYRFVIDDTRPQEPLRLPEGWQ